MEVIYHHSVSKKIGELLIEASLVSPWQIQTALHEQNIYPDLKIGEILVLHNWIKTETICFLVNTFQHKNESRFKLIGEVLVESALLTQDEVNSVLTEQKQTGLKFGEIVF